VLIVEIYSAGFSGAVCGLAQLAPSAVSSCR
jgi:hypothetical protein